LFRGCMSRLPRLYVFVRFSILSTNSLISHCLRGSYFCCSPCRI
jgi:hypothetical protein